MKNKYYVFGLIFCLLLPACKQDDDSLSELIDPELNISLLSRSLLINGENLGGNSPESNSNDIDIIFSQQSASITNDNLLFIPIGYDSQDDIDGMYLQLEGADNFWKVPFHDNRSSKKNPIVSKNFTDTFVLSVGIPPNILNGSFTINYSLYNNEGNISPPKSLAVTIKSAKDFCSDGSSFDEVNGEDGITVETYTLGDQAGWVRINYNMYLVKDRMDIKYGNKWIRSTGELITNSAPPLKECSMATSSDGFVSGQSYFEFFYDPNESKRVDIYVSGCLDGDTAWIFQLTECPKDRPTLGVHSSVPPEFNTENYGHAWVSLTENGETTLYGLWPDGHAAIEDNGSESDVRINKEGGFGAYRRFYPLTDYQLSQFNSFIEQNKEWQQFSYNCSSWAEDLVNSIVDNQIDASEVIIGVESPRKLSQSIIELEARKPTATQYIIPNLGQDDQSCSFCF